MKQEEVVVLEEKIQDEPQEIENTQEELPKVIDEKVDAVTKGIKEEDVEKVEVQEIENEIDSSMEEVLSEEKNIENEQLLVNLESIVKERTLKLQKTKNELADINLSLEKKVLEKTKKNIDLSRSILEQEKLVTIGELSAGIAHDLNTPLGVIRVGSDNVSFILDKLFHLF